MDQLSVNASKIDGNPEGGRPSEGRRVSWANTADVKTVAYVHETRKQRLYRILAQVTAASVKNLMLLDLGMIVGFPTILIPALHNAKGGGLSLTDDEASWIGSISMICQPLGSLMSGVLLEGVGRRRAMMLINAPLLLGWLLLYWASTPGLLYGACAVLGLCVGFMEAPTLTYIAEICEPRLRGVLTSYSETCVSAGIFLEYLLGSATNWQTTALISAALPLITLAALTQIPETPMWLLSRGRDSEAEASLRWLRGWTSSLAVQEELSSLSAYARKVAALDRTPPPRRRPSATSGGGDVMTPEEEQAAVLATLHERHRGSQHFTPVGLGLGGGGRRGAVEVESSSDEEEDCCQLPLCRKTAAMLQRATLRPLLLVTILFLLQHWTGITGLRPYMVEICHHLGVPGDPHWDTVVLGLVTILGFVVCVVAVKRLGKRRLCLLSFGATAASCLLLGWCALDPAALGTWAPLTLLVLVFFFSSLGVAPIPWILLSEVFPFRTRGLASGVVAALSYVFAFSATKTYFDLKGCLGLAGLLFLYGAVGLAGFAFVYFFLIETEGRSLEDIEKDYGGGGGGAGVDAAFRHPTGATVLRRSVIKKRGGEGQGAGNHVEQGKLEGGEESRGSHGGGQGTGNHVEQGKLEGGEERRGSEGQDAGNHVEQGRRGSGEERRGSEGQDTGNHVEQHGGDDDGGGKVTGSEERKDAEGDVRDEEEDSGEGEAGKKDHEGDVSQATLKPVTGSEEEEEEEGRAATKNNGILVNGTRAGGGGGGGGENNKDCVTKI